MIPLRTYVMMMPGNDSQPLNSGESGDGTTPLNVPVVRPGLPTLTHVPVPEPFTIPAGEAYRLEGLSWQLHIPAQGADPQQCALHLCVGAGGRETNIWTKFVQVQERNDRALAQGGAWIDYFNETPGYLVIGPAVVRVIAYNLSGHPATLYFGAVWTRYAVPNVASPEPPL